LYGYTAAEAIGRHIEIIVPPEMRAELSQVMSQLAAGQRVNQVDTLRCRKDGSVVHVSLQISPIRDAYGNVIGASKIARDVSERKYMEAVLGTLARASGALASLTDRESALRRAVDSVVPDFADWCFAVKLDDEGNLQEFVARHHDSFKQRVLDQLVETRTCEWNDPTVRALRTGETQFLENATADSLIDVACDGVAAGLARELDVQSVVSVPLQIRSKVIGAITFVTSNASRRFSHRDVGFAEDLARRLAIAIDNSRLLESLRTADQQKNEFLAMLAHELRNPLGAIGYANKLIPTSAADTQAELVALVDRQVRNLAHLIDGLLDVSRITRDKIQLRKEYFDGVDLLRRVSDVVRPLIESKRHRFALDIQADSIPLYGDVTRVEQILTNVLSNAIKYTQEGGDVSLTASAADGHVNIRVKDTGIGISREMLPRVFDLFSQAEQGLDRSQGGLGIGLTIARKLTELQGGTLTANSAGIGKGAEFTIRLPLSSVNQDGPDPRNNDSRAAAATLRILVVDDDHDTVRTQSLFLSTMGHCVESAHDGPTAVTVAQTFRPHAILLDLGLPGMNGFEVAKALRSRGHAKETLIAISGYGRPEDKRRCDDAGFDYHFTKPIDPNELLRTLQNVRRPRESDELERHPDSSK
jgi:PAS domain S-box-containing protein